jgi:signal transduction histidine kinase
MEAVGQLTGGVAHDFNNLLMVIASSLELLERRLPKDDPRLTGLLANASRAARRGSSLTQRMLAFARKQDLDPKPIDILDLTRGMREILERALDPGIRIETHFPLAIPKVLTDANQLESALLNLAVNARDAMPAGGRIVISAHVDVIDARHALKLPAGDGGEGMDPDTLLRATEPFFTTKGIGKGTGLGLP